MKSLSKEICRPMKSHKSIASNHALARNRARPQAPPLPFKEFGSISTCLRQWLGLRTPFRPHGSESSAARRDQASAGRDAAAGWIEKYSSRRSDSIGASAETEWPNSVSARGSSPNCSRYEYCHADTMQISIFCMVHFLVHNIGRYLLMFWRARRDSNSRPPNS